jgi:hypothetical protein
MIDFVMEKAVEVPGQEWYDLVSRGIDLLEFSPQDPRLVRRDSEGGVLRFGFVKISAGKNFYEYNGHPDLPVREGISGSLTGTCVHPEYIGLETFSWVLRSGLLLPSENYDVDWPHTISDWSRDQRTAWSYKFKGGFFNLSKPRVPDMSLGYMREEDFRRFLPKVAALFDSKYEERIWGRCLVD